MGQGYGEAGLAGIQAAHSFRSSAISCRLEQRNPVVWGIAPVEHGPEHRVSICLRTITSRCDKQYYL